MDRNQRQQEIKQLRENGMSYANIGALYNISRTRVYQIISGYKGYEIFKRGTRANNNRLFVLLEADGICTNCNTQKNLIVHHNDGNSGNNRVGNLAPICSACHTKIHKNPSPKGILW